VIVPRVLVLIVWVVCVEEDFMHKLARSESSESVYQGSVNQQAWTTVSAVCDSDDRADPELTSEDFHEYLQSILSCCNGLVQLRRLSHQSFKS
jgi:hypothetical protein